MNDEQMQKHKEYQKNYQKIHRAKKTKKNKSYKKVVKRNKVILTKM